MPRLTKRHQPLARAMAPRLSPLRMKRSKSGTGSRLDHSPSVQALYQPTDPDVISRTSARQLCKRTIGIGPGLRPPRRSEEHTSELQSLMRISYAVFCLKKKTTHTT